MAPDASAIVTWGMGLLPPLVAVGWIALVGHSAGRRAAYQLAAALGLWLGATASLARAGVLTHWDARPPPFMPLVIAGLVAALWLGLSKGGAQVARGTPLWALVGLQAFRLPLELVMHEAAAEG